MIRVVVVDDHPLFRSGLETLFATVADVEVVASAGDGLAAVSLTLAHRLDVVLMDLNLPGIGGREATRRIAAVAPEVAVLVLTMVDDDDMVLAAVRIGAKGYLLKGAAQEEVLGALQAVAAGGAVFGPGAAHRLLSGRRNRGRYGGFDLTEREAEVLSGIAEGKSTGEIARELGVSIKTVQKHTSHVLMKLQVRDRTQAALRMRGL